MIFVYDRINGDDNLFLFTSLWIILNEGKQLGYGIKEDNVPPQHIMEGCTDCGYGFGNAWVQ